MVDSPKQRRRPRPTLTVAINQLRKAGVAMNELAEATIGPDGGVSLKFGRPDASGGSDKNPWDEVLINAPDKKRAS